MKENLRKQKGDVMSKIHGVLLIASALLPIAGVAQSSAGQSGPSVPTTKVLAIGHVTAARTLESARGIMPTEVRDTVRLYLAGKIDQWYVRQDQSGVVFIMNVNTVEEAGKLLAELPLGKAKLMEFELIPLGPLNPLRALLGDSPATPNRPWVEHDHFPDFGASMEEKKSLIGRRASLLAVFAAFASDAAAQSKSKLGNEEWMRRYRAFVKASNDFVIAINDGIFDVAKWERLRTAWREIDIGWLQQDGRFLLTSDRLIVAPFKKATHLLENHVFWVRWTPWRFSRSQARSNDRVFPVYILLVGRKI
jgi:hypothetical protein